MSRLYCDRPGCCGVEPLPQPSRLRLQAVDREGNVWTTQEASLDEKHQAMGLVVAHATIDGEETVSNFSWRAWERGEAVYGCDMSRDANDLGSYRGGRMASLPATTKEQEGSGALFHPRRILLMGFPPDWTKLED